MSPPKEYFCPHCHAAKVLRGAHAFATVRCAACGEEWRPRAAIGGYRLREPLARTGLGLLFRSVDPASGAPLAVKVIRPCFASEPGDLERFTADVQLLRGLDLPHWVRVFGGGVEEDVAWLAMEWLPLGSLADRLAKEGALSEAEGFEFAVQAASALAAADVAGLRHRSVHAANFYIAGVQTYQLGGFVEAIFYDRAAEDVGTVAGPLWAVPPERVFGEPEDARSDIYALGATLYEVFSGARPYEGETIPELLFQRLDGPRAHLSEAAPKLRPSLARMIDRMLAVEPMDRFQTWEEMLEALARAALI